MHIIKSFCFQTLFLESFDFSTSSFSEISTIQAAFYMYLLYFERRQPTLKPTIAICTEFRYFFDNSFESKLWSLHCMKWYRSHVKGIVGAFTFYFEAHFNGLGIITWTDDLNEVNLICCSTLVLVVLADRCNRKIFLDALRTQSQGSVT